MNLRTLLPVGIALAVTACSSIDGTYLPSCAAYSGSEIRLANGRFHWSKFTDQVLVDEDGNEVDPFPGFPIEGVYKVSGRDLVLTPDAGRPAETLYLYEESGVVFLLTAEEESAVKAGGARPKCALRRQSPGT